MSGNNPQRRLPPKDGYAQSGSTVARNSLSCPATRGRHIFLGWSRPAVREVLDYLCQVNPAGTFGTPWDLSQYAIVLPTGWAVRRLLSQLADSAQQRGVVLFPPEVMTVGQLPERLYSPRIPLANEPTCLLAWCVAIHRLAYRDQAALRRLFPRWNPSLESPRWLAVAQELADLRYELSGSGFSFHDVLNVVRKNDPNFPDQDRWETLAVLEHLYLEALAQAGLSDIMQARSDAVTNNTCQLGKEMLLVGLVDLPRIVQQLLEQVRDQITVLTVAQPELADRFDEFGCLIPEHWQELPTIIPEDRITVCQQAADQAHAVVQALAALDNEFGVEDISIGAPDESLVPLVLDALERHGIPARYGPGRPLLQSSVWMLLTTLHEFLEQGTAEAFGSLIRHPAAEKWFATRGGVKHDLLTAFDTWYNERLPLLMDEASMKNEQGPIKEAWEALCQRFPPEFWVMSQPIRDCAERIRDILLEFFGPTLSGTDPLDETSASRRKDTLELCQSIIAGLSEWFAVPEEFQKELEWQTTPGELLRWLGHHLSSVRIPAPLRGPTVEIMGWLDIAWDDAPVTIVTSLNEGFVPSAVRHEMFLTPQIREWLQLEGSSRQVARDAYLLSMILQSRERYHLIAGRRTLDGDPLLPSRFLFSPNDEVMVRQIATFFGQDAEETSRRPPRWERSASDTNALSPPPPDIIVPWTEIRVTQFRDYLACPYRFYLRHVLQVGTLDDSAEDLDPLSFGSLAHAVLCEFARSKLRDSTDPDKIAAVLLDTLDNLIKKTLARRPRPAIPFQVEQLRERLKAFAVIQASLAEEWQIVCSEYSPAEPITLDVDGIPIRLIGRIDRIDQHKETGEFRILDYKIIENPITPEQAHLRGRGNQREWLDLQLPLYRHLAKPVTEKSPVKLGFFILPKDVRYTEVREAQWGDEELAEADEIARWVVRKIREGVFWPPNEEAEGRFPDLSPILP